MKIGIDIRLIGKKRTGDEAVFFHLVKNLAKIDNSNSDEYFLYTDRDPHRDSDLNGAINKLSLKDNFKIVFIDSPNRFWWNLWALPNYLKKNPVDVFHTQYIAPFWLPKNVKLFLTIHDISFNFFPQFIKKSDLFFLKSIIPRSLRMAEKIIAVSEFTKREIEKYYDIPEEKIEVVHNGCDFDTFSKTISDDRIANIQKKYGLPQKFILYLGTLQPRKDLPTLVEAMKIFLEKGGFNDLSLVIAGNRAARNFDKRIDESTKKFSLNDKIIFTGWIEEDDKPVLYKLAKVFVFPSVYEGFGLPILEAMAAGTPVVCSDQKALIEIGNSAVLAGKAGDAEAMAKNIRSIFTEEDLRNKLIERGKARAKEFSWSENAKKTLESYHNSMH